MKTYFLTLKPGHSVNQIVTEDQTPAGLLKALDEVEKDFHASQIAVVVTGGTGPDSLAAYSPKAYRFYHEDQKTLTDGGPCASGAAS